ncbi:MULTISPECIES: hypothetical protein [unclassified Microcoleus]|uniref:hypothetical protein n=1 Tax=unclassified Microcoleus TaxID=2642155 RepID=UPI002FD40D98
MLAGKFGDTLGEESSATDYVTDVTDVKDRRKKEEGRKIIFNAQCPIPNAQCPIPNAQCPITNAQFANLKSKI